MKSPFEEHIRAELGPLYEGLSSLHEYSQFEIRTAIGLLLSNACTAQNIGNITAAQKVLGQVPMQVLASELVNVGRETLDLDDEWQYRRFAEAIDLACPDLLSEVLGIGRLSSISEIREAAEEFDE